MLRICFKLSFNFYLVFPRLSSRAHFILLAPLPPLVDKAPPEFPPPAAPCLPGDAMATRCTKDIPTKTDEQGADVIFIPPDFLTKLSNVNAGA